MEKLIYFSFGFPMKKNNSNSYFIGKMNNNLHLSAQIRVFVNKNVLNYFLIRKKVKFSDGMIKINFNIF